MTADGGLLDRLLRFLKLSNAQTDPERWREHLVVVDDSSFIYVKSLELESRLDFLKTYNFIVLDSLKSMLIIFEKNKVLICSFSSLLEA